MQRIITAGLLLCLLSINSIASAQAAPPTTPSPELPPPILEPLTFEPTTQAPPPSLPPTVEPPKPPQRTALRDNERSSSIEGASVRTHKHWYGWQTLLVDLGSVLTIPLGGVGLAGYALGAPIVHLAHGQVGRGVGSLGLRLALPLVGGAVGCRVSGSDQHDIGGGSDASAAASSSACLQRSSLTLERSRTKRCRTSRPPCRA